MLLKNIRRTLMGFQLQPSSHNQFKQVMEHKSMQSQSSTRHTNDYEQARRLRVQENQNRLQALGVKNIAKSLTSLIESNKPKKKKKIPMDTSEKDGEYMPGSDFNDDVEQDYQEEAATKISKKKQHPKYIAPMSMNKYANLAKKRCIAPNVSRVLTSSESHMRKGQVIDTRKGINSRVPEFDKGDRRNGQLVDTNPTKQNKSRERVTKGELIKKNLEHSNSVTEGRSSVAKRKLFAIDNDDDHQELDLRFHDINEAQDDAEIEDIEDMDMNDAYEEEDSSEDDEDEDMDDLQHENDLENVNDELVDEELEVPELENEAEHEEHEVSEPENEAEHEVQQLGNEAVRNVRKRVRGPTRMPKVWAQQKGERIPVLVNAHGQPINNKSSQLTHFMGTLSRSGKYCPIHKPWNKVEDAKKQALLELLKTKFDIAEDPETDKWILQSFGRKVKNWRARLKEDFHDPSLSLQEQISSGPKQVQKKQWKKLVKYWNKEKTKMLSEKNKGNRKKKKMVQVTGKKSYARVREELKASLGRDPSRLEMFESCFSKDGTTKNEKASNAIGSNDKPGPDDVFSKVMGKDRNGDAVMYGLGVRASDVWGVIPSRSACRRENIQLKAQCEELTSTVVELQAQVKMNGSMDGSNVPPFTSHCPVVTNGPPRLRVGDEVFLKSILNPAETVARGWVKSLDPNVLVGDTEIGHGWCEVNAQVPIKKDEMLIRPYGLFSTIQDCIGATIAWPCSLISVVRED